MPELPDITIYVEALERRVLSATLEKVRLKSPSLLRSFAPPISTAEGRPVRSVSRLGKRIVLTLDGDLHLVLHLMIAGRLRWKPRGAPIPGKLGLAAFDFTAGTLLLTEAGSKRRASLHLLAGPDALPELDPGGIDVLSAGVSAFSARLLSENHTLKRALCDPHLFDGIGNAYSDEILHAARLSPVKLTSHLTPEEVGRLHAACRSTLALWTERLREEAGDAFPEKVTAFREGMAVHGRAGRPCPVCGTSVQRIAYADNETNYCPTCQTGGRLLADRALSRLLREDWPRSLAELEDRKRRLSL